MSNNICLELKNREKELAEVGIPLAKKIAQRYASASRGDFDDFFTYALEGLARAIANYNEALSNGAKFTTFARYHIKGRIFDAFRRNSPVPFKIQDLFFKGNALKNRQNLTDDEIVIQLKISKQQWKSCQDAMYFYYYRLDFYQVSYNDEWGLKTYKNESIPLLHDLLKCFGFDNKLSHRSPKWNHKMPQDIEKNILLLRQQGHTIDFIAKKVKRGNETVRKLLCKYNMSSYKFFKKRRIYFTKSKAKQIRDAARKKGKNLKQVFAEMNLSKDCIFRWEKGEKMMTDNSLFKVESWLAN